MATTKSRSVPIAPVEVVILVLLAKDALKTFVRSQSSSSAEQTISPGMWLWRVAAELFVFP
jgi:hypothetical protein